MTAQVLILAAGASSRMGGRDKLLEPVEGTPLLRRLALVGLATGHQVTVVLPPDRPARGAALDGLDLRQVTAVHAREGMAESLKAGLAALPPEAAVLLLLADLPEIGSEDLAAVLRAGVLEPQMIHRGATADGQPGHPVLLPPWLRPDLMELTGDQGAQPVLRRHADRVHLVPLPGHRAVTDLDTPEDWEAWRAGNGSG